MIGTEVVLLSMEQCTRVKLISFISRRHTRAILSVHHFLTLKLYIFNHILQLMDSKVIRSVPVDVASEFHHQRQEPRANFVELVRLGIFGLGKRRLDVEGCLTHYFFERRECRERRLALLSFKPFVGLCQLPNFCLELCVFIFKFFNLLETFIEVIVEFLSSLGKR